MNTPGRPPLGNPYLPLPVRLERVTVENDARDLKTFELTFSDPGLREKFTFVPGQFSFLGLAGVGEAPFGIASAPHEANLAFTLKKAGHVTTALHELSPGMELGLRGPYGNPYPLHTARGRNIVIVSGGFSFTTLRSVIVHLMRPDRRGDYGRITVVYGARSPGELLYKDELRAWEALPDIDLTLCVDRADGDWPATEGLVPNVLREVAPSAKNAVALVCGPPVMLRFTHPVLEELGFSPDDVYLSLENRMKCGIGKCGRCNIGEVYVCKDGPVFSYRRLRELPGEN
ncbi:MAG TPA: heterodisulfide reductase subunit F [candidate division WOR-3 bacterium]|uniref:Heterodisulfide reductase subunit F n=1 Tax=candidate division WOR-3 bacterium TaxID=2052148 RepID=A0A7V0T488_UNCW3|nr:heterodisulfide reductase subunit F [candidate division WOR-3 bacterium]